MSQLRDAALQALPEDAANATLAGRVWRPDADGPSVVALRDGAAFDISRHSPTMRDLCESADPAMTVREADGESSAAWSKSSPTRRPRRAIPTSPGSSRRSTCKR